MALRSPTSFVDKLGFGSRAQQADFILNAPDTLALSWTARSRALGPTRAVLVHLFLAPTAGKHLEALGNAATPRLVAFALDSTRRLDRLGELRDSTGATSRATKACWWIGSPSCPARALVNGGLQRPHPWTPWMPRAASFANVSFARACS